MTAVPERRRGAPFVIVASDLVRHALRTRSWILVVVVLLAVLAAVLVVVGQVTLPYAIYPAL